MYGTMRMGGKGVFALTNRAAFMEKSGADVALFARILKRNQVQVIEVELAVNATGIRYELHRNPDERIWTLIQITQTERPVGLLEHNYRSQIVSSEKVIAKGSLSDLRRLIGTLVMQRRSA